MAAVMDTKVAEALTYRARQFEKPLPDAGADKEAFSADTRLPYQRDLGRIVHSASFRRLQTKTQVMGTGEGDFHRTRLTHSLEVGHIGRGIVWNLDARDGGEYHDLLPPSELIEAICYAHDLGHPPYGHSGERALHSRMKAFGGFEGNAQTIRILAELEKYYRGEGIKPTRRLFLGVLKYPVAYSEYGATKAQGEKPPKCFYDDDKELIERALSIFSPHDVREFRTLSPAGKPKYKDFDCSIMELADDIAYGVHDLEDGIARGILKRSEIEASIRDGFKIAGVQKIREVSIDGLVNKLFSSDSCERKHAISLLVGYFIISIDVNPQKIFADPLLDYNAVVAEPTRALLDHFSKEITYKGIVRRREVQTLEFKGEKIITDLFYAFREKPLALIGEAALDPFELGAAAILTEAEGAKANLEQLDTDKQRVVMRAICDYIAGMTNPFAEKYHRRLFEPGFGSSTDEL
jgi:dGTPase